MKRGVLYFAGLLLSAAAGAAGMYLYIHEKEERRADRDIEEVREHYRKRESENAKKPGEEKPEKAAETDIPNPQKSEVDEKKKAAKDMADYRKKVRETYRARSDVDIIDEDAIIDRENCLPEIITPDEFGEKAWYSQTTLTYYEDQILVDENNRIIDNINDIIGFMALTRFGEYTVDTVFVRNDRLEAYYEVIRDRARYIDIAANLPEPIL